MAGATSTEIRAALGLDRKAKGSVWVMISRLKQLGLVAEAGERLGEKAAEKVLVAVAEPVLPAAVPAWVGSPPKPPQPEPAAPPAYEEAEKINMAPPPGPGGTGAALADLRRLAPAPRPAPAQTAVWAMDFLRRRDWAVWQIDDERWQVGTLQLTEAEMIEKAAAIEARLQTRRGA